MGTYEPIFSALGLRSWCESGEQSGGGPVSMADLLAQNAGTDAPAPSIWEMPFPSMDELHEACAAFPQSRVLTKGLEDGFLGIKDGLSLVLDPITQPLSWFLEGALWLFETTPWWIMIPALLAVVLVVSRSRKLTVFVGLCLLTV